MTLTTTALVEAVKRRGGIPESNDRYDADDIIAIASEELEESIYPDLVRKNEGYLVLKELIELQDDNGTDLYPGLTIPVPKRAFLRTLREIKFIDANDNIYNIPQVALTDHDKFPDNLLVPGNSPNGFYFIGDSFKLIGDADTLTGTLELHYVLKPPTLVNKTTEYAIVDDIGYDSDTSIFTFTASSVGAEMVTYIAQGATKLVDVYRKSTGALLATDIAVTRSSAGSGLDFTTGDFSSDDLYQLDVFQQGGFQVTSPYEAEIYLLPAGQSMYVPLPPEYCNKLVLATVARLQEGIGDTEGLQLTDSRMKRIDNFMDSVTSNRMQGEPKVITNRRGLRASLRGRR